MLLPTFEGDEEYWRRRVLQLNGFGKHTNYHVGEVVSCMVFVKTESNYIGDPVVRTCKIKNIFLTEDQVLHTIPWDGCDIGVNIQHLNKLNICANE